MSPETRFSARFFMAKAIATASRPPAVNRWVRSMPSVCSAIAPPMPQQATSTTRRYKRKVLGSASVCAFKCFARNSCVALAIQNAPNSTNAAPTIRSAIDSIAATFSTLAMDSSRCVMSLLLSRFAFSADTSPSPQPRIRRPESRKWNF